MSFDYEFIPSKNTNTALATAPSADKLALASANFPVESGYHSMFELEHIREMEDVRSHIQNCEGKHTQQAIYSTFHDALTQVCFGCQRVRSTIKR